jgi:hypothetical protein
MDSLSLPISSASLSIGSGKEGNQDQDQRPHTTIAECLNDLECELGKVVPWTCPNRLKVILGRVAMKVQKDKPTIGKFNKHF